MAYIAEPAVAFDIDTHLQRPLSNKIFAFCDLLSNRSSVAFFFFFF
jgi:hypothetical protein